MAEVIIDFVGQSNMKPVEDSLNKIDGLLEDQKKQYTDINASAEKQAQIVKKTAGEFDKLEESVKDTSKALSGGVMKKVTDEMVNAGKKADELGKNFKSAKAELKELQAQIISGKLSGDQLAQATKRAAELKDRIQDTSGAIKMLASDTRSIDLVVEGARGLVAGFTLAKSATALFGDENKELEKSLVKVQASMAVLTSVQEIANIVTTKGGIATTVYGYAIKGVEAIQKAFAISSAAAWATATAGVTLLIGLLVTVVSSFKSAAEVQRDYNKEIDDTLKAQEKAANFRNAEQDSYIEKLRAQRKSEEEIQKFRKVFAKSRQADLTDEIDKLEFSLLLASMALEEQMQLKEKGKKTQEDVNKAQETYNKVEDEITKKKQERKKAENEEIDAANTIIELGKKKQKQIEEENARNEAIQKEKDKQAALTWQREQREAEERARTIEDNRKLELALIEDFQVTREQLDAEYTQFVIDNAATGRTSYVEFEKQKRDALQKTKDAEIEQAKIVMQLTKNRELQLGLMKDTGLTMQQIDDEYFAWVKTKRADEKADFEEFEKFKREEFKKTAEKQKETQQLAINAAIDFTKIAFDTVFTIAEQNRQAQTDSLLSNLEKEKETELAKIEELTQKGVLTKEQEESKKAAINKKYADQERAIKKRAWEAERQAKLAQAAINGALAITQILATVSYADFGINKAIQIALAAAATAGQIAIIASQPTPQFAKGTKGGKKTPKGFKIVGEEGPELIYTPGGEKVITAPDTAKILDAYNINTTKMPNMNKDKSDVTQIPIFDYDKLSRAVASEMIKQPRLQVNIDEKGFSKRIIENRKRIEYLNNKFKFN